MQSREHVDLVKMAITAMMVTLVLSALLSLFYFLYTQVSKASYSVTQTVTSTTTEKLSDLCNTTNSGDYPWVTSVANAISEVDDANLLYVQVINKNTTPETQMYFTYNDVTISGVPTSQIKAYTSPLDEASKYLLGYSNKRCGVQYLTGNDGTIQNGMTFDCMQITIFK